MKEIESWKNGEWIPNSKIGTQLWDAHYFFGWAVFDAFRTYNGKIHMYDCHIHRFYRSARMCSIEVPLKKEHLKEKISEVMKHNREFFKDDEYRFMVFLSPGNFKIYKDMGVTDPSLTINVTTTSRYAPHIYPYLEKGFVSLITQQRQIPSRYLDPKIKSCSRLHYGLADTEAATYGEGVLPILLDEHGYICESSGSNVGFIKDEEIFLPQSKDMLQGCTINFVEQVVKNKVSITYGDWEPYDLVNADALFYTSTFLGVMPSYELIYKNKKFSLNKKKAKKVYETIVAEYSKAVDVNVYDQWRKWYEML